MNRLLLKFSLIIGAAVLVVSCKKNNYAVDQDLVPPAVVKFNTIIDNDTASSYLIRDVNNTFKLPIGVTTVSDKDRTITVTYQSNSAIKGAQYNAPSTIVIPAGKTVDTLVIQGLFSGYTTTTKVDTLKITLGGDVPTSAYKGTYTLYMRKYCNVNASGFAGDYTRTIEKFGNGNPYGPYKTTVTSVTSTGPTSARIGVANIWDTGWGPIEFNMDWSDPGNHLVTIIPKTSGIGDAGDLDPSYAGMQVAVRAFAGQNGTFNSCDNTITLRFQLGVAGLGYFGSLYTVNMAR